MKQDKSTIKKITRRVNIVVWSIIGFFLAGYLPATYLQQKLAVTVTVVICAMGVIPYASRIAHPLKSGLVAGLLGAVAGFAMMVLPSVDPGLSAQVRSNLQLKYAGSVSVFCAAVGAVFGYLARQRRRQAEDEWERHE